jgi:hypothetical protein
VFVLLAMAGTEAVADVRIPPCARERDKLPMTRRRETTA